MQQFRAQTNKSKNTKTNDRSLFQLLEDDPTILDAIMDENIVDKNQQNEGWPDLNKQIDNKTKQQLLDQDIKFDYVKNMTIYTQQNRLNFTPSERSAQYRYHLKQPIEQIVKYNNLRDQNVCLSYNKFNPEQIRAYLQYNNGQNIDNTMQIRSLFMAWARSKTILHFLALKKFQNMTSLNIAANFIGSLELLSRVQMPVLQDIYLWKNNITQVRSLKRCKWPNIRNIDLHINYIAEVKDLRYLGSKTLQSIVLDNCLITNQHEAVVTCSGSPKSRISLHCNYLIKYIGRPKERRRKKAIDFQPCLMKVRYV